MENAVTSGPDAIVLTPMSKAALSAPTERAMAAGIPVVLCNSGLDTDQYATEVGRNLYLTGFESAAHLGQMLGGSGNVVLFHGIAGVDTAETWKQAALDAFSQYPAITVVSEAFANWSPADSKTAMEGILASSGQIDGVWTGGSEMAIGAINALIEAGRPMPRFGVTNPQNGFLRLVKEQGIEFWGAPYPPSVAKLCLDYALKVLHGESVPKYNDVIDLWQGVGSIDNSTIDTLHRPECTDEYIGPVFLPDDQLQALGFCQAA
jgi:ABC-type sugar transport system substrate-binding protein